MQTGFGKVSEPRSATGGGWLDRPAILRVHLPDGQPRLSSSVRLHLQLCGWGFLTIVARSADGISTHRSRLGVGLNSVHLEVPAGAPIQIRIANIWGADALEFDVASPDATLDLGRLSVSIPLDLNTSRLLQSVRPASRRRVTLRTRRSLVRVGAQVQIPLAAIKPPDLRLQMPRLMSSRLGTPVKAQSLRFAIPKDDVEMVAHCHATRLPDIYLSKEGTAP